MKIKNKILILNTHPFTDKEIMQYKNDFLFVSTTGQYPGEKPRSDMKNIIEEDLFTHAISNFVSLKNMGIFKQEMNFLKALFSFRPDIIVCNISQIRLAMLSFTYSRIFWKKVYFYHEFWHLPPGMMYRIFEFASSLLLRLSDHVYCIGLVHEKYLRKRGIKKIKKIPPIYHREIKKKDLLSKIKKTKRKIIITYVGRIVPYKGLDRLLHAFAALHQKYNIFLNIIGSQHSRDQYPGKNKNFEKECRKFAEKNIKKSSYKFYGFREDGPDFIKKSDIVVMPNRFVDDRVPCEAWGIVLAEALINDVPVVSTDAVGSAFDLIEDGKNGYIVSWKDINKLQDAIENIIRLYSGHR